MNTGDPKKYDELVKLLNRTVPLDDGTYGYIFSDVGSHKSQQRKFKCHVCSNKIIISAKSLFIHSNHPNHRNNLALDKHPRSRFMKTTHNRPPEDVNDDEEDESKDDSVKPKIVPGEPVPPGLEGIVDSVCQIQNSFDNYKSGPLIGLEYIVELVSIQKNVEPRYICLLCEKKGDPRSVMVHVTSYNHYLKYICCFFRTVGNKLNMMPKTAVNRKSVNTATVKVAEAIEKHYGRLNPISAEMETFSSKKYEILREIDEREHFRETATTTFLELVTAEKMKLYAASPVERDIPAVSNKNVEPNPEVKPKAENSFKSDPTSTDPSTNTCPSSTAAVCLNKKFSICLKKPERVIPGVTKVIVQNQPEGNSVKEIEEDDDVIILGDDDKDPEVIETLSSISTGSMSPRSRNSRSRSRSRLLRRSYNSPSRNLPRRSDRRSRSRDRIRRRDDERSNRSNDYRSYRSRRSLDRDQRSRERDRSRDRREARSRSRNRQLARSRSRDKSRERFRRDDARVRREDDRRDDVRERREDDRRDDARVRREDDRRDDVREKREDDRRDDVRGRREDDRRDDVRPRREDDRRDDIRGRREDDRRDNVRGRREDDRRDDRGRREDDRLRREREYRYQRDRDRHYESSERTKQIQEEKLNKLKWNAYRLELKDLDEELINNLKYYQRRPEKHPNYSEEWKSFWNRRYKEIQLSGQDPSQYDFKPEWILYWEKKMKEFHEKECITKKEELKRKHNLDELKDIRITQDLQDVSPPTPENEKDVTVSDIKKTWKALTGSDITAPSSKRSPSPWESNKEKHEPQHAPSQHWKPSQGVAPVPPIVHCLRMLSVLETQLGFQAARVIEVLSQALALEKTRTSGSMLLLQNKDIFLLFETLKEKLRGQLMAGIVARNLVLTTRNVINAIEKMLASNPLKPEVFEPVTIPGVGSVDKVAVAQKIASALVKLGKINVTQDELEQLINAVVGMANASSISADISSDSFFSQLNINNSTASSHINSIINSMIQTAQQSVNVGSGNVPCLETQTPINLVPSYSISMEVNEPENSNTSTLSSVKLENPLLGGVSENISKTTEPANKLSSSVNERAPSPFSLRSGGGANPVRSPEPKVKLIDYDDKNDNDEDDDDYSFEDVINAASQKLKMSEKETKKQEDINESENSQTQSSVLSNSLSNIKAVTDLFSSLNNQSLINLASQVNPSSDQILKTSHETPVPSSKSNPLFLSNIAALSESLNKVPVLSPLGAPAQGSIDTSLIASIKNSLVKSFTSENGEESNYTPSFGGTGPSGTTYESAGERETKQRVLDPRARAEWDPALKKNEQHHINQSWDQTQGGSWNHRGEWSGDNHQRDNWDPNGPRSNWENKRYRAEWDDQGRAEWGDPRSVQDWEQQANQERGPPSNWERLKWESGQYNQWEDPRSRDQTQNRYGQDHFPKRPYGPSQGSQFY